MCMACGLQTAVCLSRQLVSRRSLASNGDKIGQNFTNMTNGYRIMTSPFDDAQMAFRDFLRHLLRHANGKASIGIAVPQANRHLQFVEGKSPRLGKQLRIRQYALSRRFPSAALTFETSFKG